MPFDLDAARKHYSDDEIADFLAKQNNFDYKGAVDAGHDPDEVLNFLAGKTKTSTKTEQPSESQPIQNLPAQQNSAPVPEIKQGFDPISLLMRALPSSASDAVSGIAPSFVKGAAAASLPGMALNAVRGISDVGRLGADALLSKLSGLDVNPSRPNFVPTSNELLDSLAKATGGNGIPSPESSLGKLGDQALQFGVGGAMSGLPFVRSALTGALSEGAGQATEGTPYEVPARILAALGGDLGLSRVVGSKPAIKTAEKQKEIASAYYKQADDAGLKIPEGALTNWYKDSIKKFSPSGTVGGASGYGDELTSLVSDYKKALESNKGVSPADTFESLQQAYSTLGAKAAAIRKTQGSNDTVNVIEQAKHNLVKTVQDMDPPSDLSKNALNAWKEAKKNWFQSIKTQRIEGILEDASTADQPAKKISSGMAALVKENRKTKVFSPQEIKQIKKAAQMGIEGEALRGAGSRLGGIVSGTATGAALGGPIGALIGTPIGYVASMPFRKLGESLQAGKAEDVIRQIQLGRTRDYKPSALEMFMSKRDKDILKSRRAQQISQTQPLSELTSN